MKEKARGCSGFALKMTAVVTMTVDHVGKVFFPDCMWMTMIGRLAFPLAGLSMESPLTGMPRMFFLRCFWDFSCCI